MVSSNTARYKSNRRAQSWKVTNASRLLKKIPNSTLQSMLNEEIVELLHCPNQVRNLRKRFKRRFDPLEEPVRSLLDNAFSHDNDVKAINNNLETIVEESKDNDLPVGSLQDNENNDVYNIVGDNAVNHDNNEESKDNDLAIGSLQDNENNDEYNINENNDEYNIVGDRFFYLYFLKDLFEIAKTEDICGILHGFENETSFKHKIHGDYEMMLELLRSYCKGSVPSSTKECKELYQKQPVLNEESQWTSEANQNYHKWVETTFHSYFSYKDFMWEETEANVYGYILHPQSSLIKIKDDQRKEDSESYIQACPQVLGKGRSKWLGRMIHIQEAWKLANAFKRRFNTQNYVKVLLKYCVAVYIRRFWKNAYVLQSDGKIGILHLTIFNTIDS
jgi:hypothetical protein